MRIVKRIVKTVYIAGPMTGRPKSNFPAFNRVARSLRRSGRWKVINPAENFGGDTTRPRKDYMRLNIAALLKCDAIYVLADWRRSKDASLEVAIAEAFGLDIL